MKHSTKVQVDVDCRQVGLKKYPITGYPITYFKENYQKPTYGREESKARRRLPPPPIHAKSYPAPVGVCSVPRYRLNYINQYVNVPVVQKVAKVVEIPEVREITKYVDVVKVIDVPVEQVRMVPKLKVREVEKIRHVPGPVEYIDIPQEVIVHKPRKEIVEKIHEVPVIEDIEVEVPYYVPTPVGPPEEIRIEVPLPYDIPKFCYKPERALPPRMSLARHVTQPEMFPYETNGEYETTCVTAVKTDAKNHPLFYSSPPLGSVVSHGTTPLERNYRRKKTEKRMDEMLYNYNIQYGRQSMASPPVNEVRRRPSNINRSYSVNNCISCKSCNENTKKPHPQYKLLINAEKYNRSRHNDVNSYNNGKLYRSHSRNYVNMPVSQNRYYYSYSDKNCQNNNNYVDHSVKERDTSWNQIHNAGYQSRRGSTVSDIRRKYVEDNYNGGDYIHTVRKQSSRDFNKQHRYDETYYGDESNYIYRRESLGPRRNRSNKQVAELIVKKSSARYH